MTRLALPALAALALACAAAPPKPVDVPPLTAEVLKLEAKEQSLTGFTAVATIKVANPGPDAVTLADGEVVVVMDEKEVSKQETNVDKQVPAGGDVAVELSGKASYAKDGAEVEALAEKKTLDYALKGDIAVKRPGGKEDFVEWAKAGSVRTPRMPVARMYTLQATRSEKQVDIVFLVEVSNPNPFDLKIGKIAVKVALNDRPVGNHETIGGSVPVGGATQYSIPMTVTPGAFGKDLMQLAKQNRVRYTMTGEMDLGLVKVPVSLTGGVPFSP